MTQGEDFSRVAEEHLFVRDMAAHTYGVHAHAGDVGTARAIESSVGGIGGRCDSRTESRFGDGLGRVGRRTRRGIQFVGVVHLNDFDGLEVGGGFPCEAHEQHGTQGEVGSDDDAHSGVRGEEALHVGEARFAEARGAHHEMDAPLDAVLQRPHDGVRGREVHCDPNPGILQSGQGIADVDGRSQVEVVRRIDGPDDLGTHAASGADDSDLDHDTTLVGCRRASGGATRAAALHDVPMRMSLPLLALASSGALVAGVLVGSTSPAAAESRTTVPLPAIAQIPGSTIFTGALQDLAPRGYLEREYTVTVTDPQVYSYVGDTTETTVAPAPEGDYRSRFVVRMPSDPTKFNGRVLVEMMNTTALVDLDIAWEQAHDYLMREGWAYVGITVQQTGIRALSGFKRQPDRYKDLGLNLMTPAAAADPTSGARDPSIAWDLTSQVGALFARGGATSPLDGYDVESVFLTGQSQMAGYAVTYVNAVHPRHQVFDGFLVAYRGTRATNLQYATAVDGAVPPTSGSESQRRLSGGGTPVINLQTETDPPGFPSGQDAAVWRPDSDEPTDRFRLWEVAGSSHNDRHGAEQALGVLTRDFGLSFAPACDWKGSMGVNDFTMRFAWHSALEGLAAWHEVGTAPASVKRITRVDGDVARDSRGNARGGLRLSRMDVPVATYGPFSTGGLFCNLTGWQKPFSHAAIQRLYPTTADYVSEVRTAAQADVAAGILLPEDAATLVKLATRGPAAEGRTIKKY